MFDHIGYHFENLTELLYFVDWLQANFETPEAFEEYLLEKMPYINDLDDSYITITSVDGMAIIDDHELEDASDIDVSFWNIVNNGLQQEGSNDTTIPGTD